MSPSFFQTQWDLFVTDKSLTLAQTPQAVGQINLNLDATFVCAQQDRDTKVNSTLGESREDVWASVQMRPLLTIRYERGALLRDKLPRSILFIYSSLDVVKEGSGSARPFLRRGIRNNGIAVSHAKKAYHA
ncbi:hypothetical protein CEXT_381071 [Caerostris extrusa]|uniref:Uncharacterized protein n=1 Tax=Caerostris extrusa TaxID=172846 RepID=A0AAV4SHK7_CAEEX|nr:hypothetical protein CEXT_381071 [Caerostris extrusa]